MSTGYTGVNRPYLDWAKQNNQSDFVSLNKGVPIILNRIATVNLADGRKI